MFVHLVLDGSADSALGVGVDCVSAATRLVAAQLVDTKVRAATLAQRVVSLDGFPVTSGSGRPIAVDGAWQPATLTRGDVVVLPGLFGATEQNLEARLAEPTTQRLVEGLRVAHRRGATLAASCASTFLLAEAGVLDGASATTTWWLAPSFARRHPSVALDVDRMVVDAGRVVTAGSAFAHADLMLTLLAQKGGPSLAQRVARYLVLDHRTSQSRYMIREHLRVSDPAVHAAERFVAKHVTRQVGATELARAAGVSPRTLARRVHAALGITPHDLVVRVRVHHAAHLLETTKLSVDTIANRVGYADAAAFRKVFRRVYGQSPRGLRRVDAA